MDVADLAQSTEELVLKEALARVPPPRGGNGGLHCLNCTDEIPEGRRRAVPGCCLCVDCQDDMERGMGR
jgi:phage/conjugal plasmid C-4 type zinc finger TraR family protein